MNEDRMVTESIAKEGQMVSSTVNSNGWQKVIRPALENRITALIGDFCNATTYEEFVRIQQGMNAIKGILDFIEIKLIEGKEALGEIRKEP